MRASRRLLVLALLLMLPAGATARRARPEPIPCPDDVAAALAAACPCDAAENHGQYVRCVARFRNTLRKSGCLTDAERGVLRCAAHSTCGREGAVVCCVPSRYGVRTRIARDEGRCIAAKGTPLGTGSTCVACLVTTTSTSTSSSSSSSTSSTSSTSTSTSTTVAAGGVYGNAVEFPAASAHAPHFLVGGPVMVADAGTLTHLAVIAKAGGPNVAIGLYSSNAMGEPNQLVASSAVTALGVGPVEIPVTPTTLTAGKYWLFGVFDTDASIGIDESDPSAAVRYVSRPFGSPLPNPFGLASSYSGQRFNYYIRVE
jgi:hypothetical protein